MAPISAAKTLFSAPSKVNSPMTRPRVMPRAIMVPISRRLLQTDNS